MRITNIDADKNDCPNGWSNIASTFAAYRASRDDIGCYSAQFSTH